MKIKVKESDFNFLKKISGIDVDQVIIKKMTSKDNREVNMAIAINESADHAIQSIKLSSIFNSKEDFGLRNIKLFFSAIKEYGEMDENEINIVFSNEKSKITFRKSLKNSITKHNFPDVDLSSYIAISLSINEVNRIREGLKNNFSDYVFFILKDNKLSMKIGKFMYENVYEEDIKSVESDDRNIEFVTSLKRLSKFFSHLDDDSKFTLYLKEDSYLVFLEKNEDLYVKSIITPVVSNDLNDEK